MIDKILVREFVPGVLVDVRRHITVQHLQGQLKGFVARGQLRVLLPEIGFQNFGCRQKSQNGDIARREPGIARGGPGTHPAQEQATGRQRRDSGQTQSLHKGATAKGAAAGIELSWFR